MKIFKFLKNFVKLIKYILKFDFVKNTTKYIKFEKTMSQKISDRKQIIIMTRPTNQQVHISIA